jgi:outer membrane protein OmpA-like peptidoglycan-associated protein
MRKFVLIALTAFLISAVMAYPGFWGTKGLLRTISADNEGKSYLSLSLHGNYFQKDLKSQISGDSLRAPTHRNSTAYISAAFAPVSFLEVSGGIGMQLIQDPDVYRAEGVSTEWGFSDTYIGLKASYTPVWWVTGGAFLFNTFPTGSSALKDSGFTNEYGTYGGVAALTFNLHDERAHIPFPLKIHANVGRLEIRKINEVDDGNEYLDQLFLRGGLEIPAGMFTIFGEYSTEQNLGKDNKFAENPMRVTPGVRFTTGSASLDLAVDIGLGDSMGSESWRSLDNMPWKINLGVTFITRLVKEQPIPIFAEITGRVTDADNGKPLTATVSHDDQMLDEANYVTGPDGIYKLRAGIGTHNIKFVAEGYETYSKAIAVKDSLGVPLDVSLKALNSFGTLTGKVSDAGTSAPLSATITFADSKIAPIKSSSETGAYKTELPVGSYTMVVEAKDYRTVNEIVVIEKGKITQKDIQMRLAKTSTDGKVSGTVTDATTGQPVRALVAILEGGFSPIIVDPTTGAYSAVLPAGTYNLKATAEGYLPSTYTVVIEVEKTKVQAITLKPIPVSTITGKVVNTKDKMPLSANISFPGSNLPSIKADENGIFKQSVPPGTYTVKAEFETFIPQAFPVTVEDGKTAVQNFELIKPGEKITLTGIYFDFNKSTIKPESRPTLDQAIKILRDNPTIRVRIAGHTDSKGSDEYNMKLSQSRADAVKAYLVQNGSVDASRIESVGKGEIEPIATNDTDEGRSLNRRIEFIVLGEK